jgi:hypothetical protein
VSINVKPPAETVRHPGEGNYGNANVPSFNAKWGDQVFLWNNVEYGYYQEHGTPPLKRAQPMIKPTYEYLVPAAELAMSKINMKYYP